MQNPASVKWVRGEGLNRYISLLNAEPIAGNANAKAKPVLIDTYRCLMQNFEIDDGQKPLVS